MSTLLHFSASLTAAVGPDDAYAVLLAGGGRIGRFGALALAKTCSTLDLRRVRRNEKDRK
jgi:hypothetical protein